MRDLTGSSALNTPGAASGGFPANIFLTPPINSTGFTREDQ